MEGELRVSVDSVGMLVEGSVDSVGMLVEGSVGGEPVVKPLNDTTSAPKNVILG